MARKSSIIPTDISSSREYYGLNNSQDIYKGTSFKFSGEWVANTHYFNDEYIIDFVTYPYLNDEGEEVMAMWACTRNHLSQAGSEPMMNSRYWTYVMSGATGAAGQVYVPKVDASGNLVFTLSNEPSASVVNIATIKGKDGVDGKDGKNGLDGKDGKVYIPSVKDGIMTFSLADSGMAAYRVDVKDFKGEKGEAGKPVEIKILPEGPDRVLYYREEGASNWIKAGNVGGQPGKSPKLTVWFDDNSDIRDDQIRWGYDGVPVSEWTTLCYLDDLRGDSVTGVEVNDDGKIEITTSYKRKTENGEYLIESSTYTSENSVLPTFKQGYTNTLSPDDDAHVTVTKAGPNEWDLNFAVPRGKDAKIAVSRTVTVESDVPAAVINEGTDTNAQLRFDIPKGEKGDKGDENVYIGCEPPEDLNMIWYNPCEQTLNGMTSLDFLYQAYLDTPGKRIEENGEFKNVHLERDLFEKAIGNISPINGFEVRVRSSFEALGDPTVDKLGFIYLIPSSSESVDMYEEWIVVDTAETEVGASSYKWEKWGSSSVSLDNYYTKDQVDQHITNAVNQFSSSFNGGEVDASGWE